MREASVLCLNVVFISSCSAELLKRRQKAQDQGDIAEEAKLCNAIGDLYAEIGRSHAMTVRHVCVVEKGGRRE